MDKDSPEDIRSRAENTLLTIIKDKAMKLFDSCVEEEENNEKVCYLDQQDLANLWGALERYNVFESTMRGVH